MKEEMEVQKIGKLQVDMEDRIKVIAAKKEENEKLQAENKERLSVMKTDFKQSKREQAAPSMRLHHMELIMLRELSDE